MGVVEKNGKELQFQQIGTVRGDSLIGNVDRSRIAIALSDVEAILVEEIYKDRILTAAVVFVVAVGVGFAILYSVLASAGD